MKSNVFAILLALPMGAMCAAPTTCAASTYMKFDTANKCCMVDSTKCYKATVTCATGNYLAMSKWGTTKGTDAKTTCCAAVATCKEVTCMAGMKKMSSVTDATKCSGHASKCQSTCCEKDTTKCGGNTVTCDSGMWQDTAKAGTALVNGTASKVTCCSAVGTCDKVSCAGGWKTKSGVGNTTKCSKSAAMCTMDAACCEKDTTTCGGSSVKCGKNKIWDSTKYNTKPTTLDVASCCKDAANADDCPTAKKKGTTSGAQELHWKATTLILAITGSAAALWM